MILLLHINYLAVYYSLYKINTEQLIAICCEKKVANCNAHCYLDKKMNNEDHKHDNATTSDIKLKLSEYFVIYHLPVPNSNQTDIFYSDNCLIPFKDICTDIEHPPQL